MKRSDIFGLLLLLLLLLCIFPLLQFTKLNFITHWWSIYSRNIWEWLRSSWKYLPIKSDEMTWLISIIHHFVIEYYNPTICLACKQIQYALDIHEHTVHIICIQATAKTIVLYHNMVWILYTKNVYDCFHPYHVGQPNVFLDTLEFFHAHLRRQSCYISYSISSVYASTIWTTEFSHVRNIRSSMTSLTLFKLTTWNWRQTFVGSK